MYCKHCGSNLPEGAPACPACGAAVTPPYTPPAAAGAYTPPGQPASAQPPYIPATPQPPIKPYTFPEAEAPAPPAEAMQPANPPAAPAPASAPGPAAGGQPRYAPYNPLAPQPADAPAAPVEHYTPPTGGHAAPGGPVPTVWSPADGPAAAPAPSGKRNTGIIIAAAAVVVVAIVVVLVLLLGADPKKQLRQGIEKTFSILASENAAAMKKFGLAGFGDALRDGPAEVELSMGISQPGQPGMSLTGDAYTDYENKKAEMDLAMDLFGSSYELEVGLDGDLLAFGLPGILDGSYGLHTETLGQDYHRSVLAEYLPLDIAPDLSLDLFELMNPSVSAGDLSLIEDSAALLGHYDALWDAATVTRDGSEDVMVNGVVKNCAAYDLYLHREALATFLRDCQATLADDESLTSLPASLGELADELEYTLDGDITGRAFLLKRQLARIELAATTQGEELSLVLQFGGEHATGDALDFALTLGSRVLFSYASEGDTTLREGVYTNKITFQAAGGAGATRGIISLQFDPAAEQDNLNCTLSVPSILTSANVVGTLRVDSAAKTGVADLHTITLDVAGERVGMNLRYAVSPSGEHSFAPLNPAMLFDMNEDQVQSFYYDLMMGLYLRMGLF